MSTKSNGTSAVDQDKNNVLRYDSEHLSFVTQNELLRIENNALRKRYEEREKGDNAVDGDEITKNWDTFAGWLKEGVREILSDDMAFPHRDSQHVRKLRSLLSDELDLVDDHMVSKTKQMLADAELATANSTKRKRGTFGDEEESE